MASYDNPGMKYEMQQPSATFQQPPTTVMMPHQQVTVVRTEGTPWSWCSVVTASFALCFCTLFGYISIVFALMSYSDHKSQDFNRSESKRKCAMGWGITGIVIGFVWIIVIIIISVVVWNRAVSNVYGNPYYNGYGG